PDYSTSGGTTSAPENYNITKNCYQIRINKLLYDVINRRQSTVELIIYPVSPFTRPNRCAFAGYQHPNLQLRPSLHIIRSK
ncbi:MAG TPA: hypothetical protein PK990_01645, partial [Salinivirgaceae bacterium]|nr:hypothetical protein [Salinivirgaceae bacterium]